MFFLFIPIWMLLAVSSVTDVELTTRLIQLEGLTLSTQLVDLDRDGRLDVLVEKMNSLSWLPGQGAADFGAPRLVNGGSGWKPLEFRELDGDGWLDALGRRSAPAELVFVRGDGSGGFAAPVSLAVGTFTAWASVDLELDGDLDLLAWESVTSSLRSFTQVAGAWLPGTVLTLPGASVSALAAGDLDHDGRVDVALSLSLPGVLPQLQLVVVHGRTGGGFGGRWSTPFPFASQLAAADIDGDGAVELLATTFGRVYGIRHQALQQYGVATLAKDTSSFSRCADADSDGDVDLLVTTTEGARLCLNDGTGQFSERANLLTHPSASGCDLADLDGDGAAEVVGPASGGRVAVTRSNGNGGWDDLHVGRSIASLPIAAGDVDGDGLEDLLLDAGGLLEIARGTGQGLLLPAGQIALSTTNGAHARDLRDLDADGDLDILLSQWTGTYEVLANDGTGAFAPPAPLPFFVTEELVWADYDGDGIDDALRLAGASLTLTRGLAGGGFAPAVVTQYPTVQTRGAFSDVDGDGACDVVLRHPGVGLVVWMCTSQGSFVQGTTLPWTGTTQQIVGADFDGDGFGDVTWLDRVARRVLCARGSAVGTLTTPVVSPMSAPSDPQAFLFAVELDGDGLPDLVAHAAGLSGAIEPEVRLSLGGGQFGRPSKFAGGAVSYSLVPIDVNGDGQRDFVVDNRYESRPILLLQR